VGNELCADVVSYGFRRFRPDWHFFFTHSHGTRRVLFIDEFHVYKVFTRFIKYHHDDFPGYVNAIVCMNFGEGDGLLRDFITAWWSIVLVRIILLLLYFNSYEMWCFRNTCFFQNIIIIIYNIVLLCATDVPRIGFELYRRLPIF